jgi:hypothetical protein
MSTEAELDQGPTRGVSKRSTCSQSTYRKDAVRRARGMCQLFCVNDQGLFWGFGMGLQGKGVPSPAQSMY